jgi:hypothetical protein
MQNGGVIRLRAPRGVLAEWKAEGGHPWGKEGGGLRCKAFIDAEADLRRHAEKWWLYIGSRYFDLIRCKLEVCVLYALAQLLMKCQCLKYLSAGVKYTYLQNCLAFMAILGFFVGLIESILESDWELSIVKAPKDIELGSPSCLCRTQRSHL